MLKYLSNKIFVYLFLCFTFSGVLQAANCNNRVFTVKIADAISVLEVLNQLGNTCDFSVIIRPSDEEANDAMNRLVTGISIKDLSLRQIFEILISQNDLIYNYRQNVLTISSIETRTFKIDYITSVRSGKATMVANADATPSQTTSGSGFTGGGGAGGGQEEHTIETTEEFNFWEKIAEEINSVMNTGRERYQTPAPIVNANAGLVSVTGTKSQLERVAGYIRKLNNSLKKQVILDVRIVAIDLNNDFKKGVDWSRFSLGFTNLVITNEGTTTVNTNTSAYGYGNPGSSFTFGNIKNNIGGSGVNSWASGFIVNGGINLGLDGVMNFLETTGHTRIISSPKITTMNNQQALISVGDNINYLQMSSTTYGAGDQTNESTEQYTLFIGVLLNILPQISDDGRVMLRINPSLSNFKYAEDSARPDPKNPRLIAPDTLQKKLSTVVQVNSGDTIVIGGLITQESGNTINKVPLLGDIPVLGYLFKSDARTVKNTELVFVITPKVVDLDNLGDIQSSLKDIGFSEGLF